MKNKTKHFMKLLHLSVLVSYTSKLKANVNYSLKVNFLPLKFQSCNYAGKFARNLVLWSLGIPL